jgi:hypothetical protein
VRTRCAPWFASAPSHNHGRLGRTGDRCGGRRGWIIAAATQGAEGKDPLAMLHRLTIGHLDPAAVERRQTVPTKALEMDVVHRLPDELGENDAEGNITLGGCKVRFHNAAVSCLRMVGNTNNEAEEFDLRMIRETGCLLADVDCGRLVDPGRLVGLNGHSADVTPMAKGKSIVYCEQRLGGVQGDLLTGRFLHGGRS